MTLPLGLWAQEERIMDVETFYALLAQKDAQYELSYSFTNDDDERDYQNHKMDCASNCLHSELFIKHASIYMKLHKENEYLEGIAFVNDN